MSGTIYACQAANVIGLGLQFSSDPMDNYVTGYGQSTGLGNPPDGYEDARTIACCDSYDDSLLVEEQAHWTACHEDAQVATCNSWFSNLLKAANDLEGAVQEGDVPAEALDDLRHLASVFDEEECKEAVKASLIVNLPLGDSGTPGDPNDLPKGVLGEYLITDFSDPAYSGKLYNLLLTANVTVSSAWQPAVPTACDSSAVNDSDVWVPLDVPPSDYDLEADSAVRATIIGAQYLGSTFTGRTDFLPDDTRLMTSFDAFAEEWTVHYLTYESAQTVTVSNRHLSVDIDNLTLHSRDALSGLTGGSASRLIVPAGALEMLATGFVLGKPYRVPVENVTALELELVAGKWRSDTVGLQYVDENQDRWTVTLPEHVWE